MGRQDDALERPGFFQQFRNGGRGLGLLQDILEGVYDGIAGDEDPFGAYALIEQCLAIALGGGEVERS